MSAVEELELPLRGVPEEQIRWRTRLLEEQGAHDCGMAMLCPTCWRPIGPSPGSPRQLTGRPGCPCEDIDRTGVTALELLDVHGLGALRPYLVQLKRSGTSRVD